MAACLVECASCTDAIYTCCWPHEPHGLPALSGCCLMQTFACADPDGLSCRQVLRPRPLEDGRRLQPPLRLRVISRLPRCAAERPFICCAIVDLVMCLRPPLRPQLVPCLPWCALRLPNHVDIVCCFVLRSRPWPPVVPSLPCCICFWAPNDMVMCLLCCPAAAGSTSQCFVFPCPLLSLTWWCCHSTALCAVQQLLRFQPK